MSDTMIVWLYECGECGTTWEDSEAIEDLCPFCESNEVTVGVRADE